MSADPAPQTGENDFSSPLAACLVFDPETMAVFACNPQASQYYGYPSDALLALTVDELCGEEDRALFRRVLHRPDSPGRAFWRHQAADGSVRHVEAVIFDLPGDLPRRRALVLRDAGPRRRALESLRDRERSYRTMVELSPEGVAILVDGRVAFSNRAFRDLLGLPADRDPRGLELAGFLHPDCRERHFAEMRRVAGQQVAGMKTELLLLKPMGAQTEVEAEEFSVSFRGLPAVQVLMRDISERKRMERAMREGEERYKGLADAAFNGVAVHQDGRIISCNRAFESIFGYGPGELEGRPLSQVAAPSFGAFLATAFERRLEYPLEIDGLRRDGVTVHVELCSKACTQEGRPALVTAVRDLTLRRRAEEIVRRQAQFDSLTGLPNRSSYQERLTRAVAATAAGGKPLAVMFLDLDRFKPVNDTLGHHMGDLLLKAVATRIQDVLGEGEMVARLGGDEFTLLMEGLEGYGQAEAAARRVLEAFKDPFQLEGHELRVSSSLGLSLCPEHGTDPHLLMKKADVAMYRAKQRGRNQFQVYRSSMESGDRDLELGLEMENGLHLALQRGEFTLHYQPQYDLAKRAVTGMEALLRWNHPVLGMLLPEAFLPLAEETMLIQPIGEWVLKESCRQLKAWHLLGYAPLSVSVNLSALQLQKHTLVYLIAGILEETGLAPHDLELELTESQTADKPALLAAILKDLDAMGVRAVLDDFGHGSGSLTNLRELPLKGVKMSRVFITGLGAGGREEAIVSAVTGLCRDLGLESAAKGVETQAQLSYLKGLPLGRVQGSLISPPLQPPEAEALFERQRLDPEHLAHITGT